MSQQGLIHRPGVFASFLALGVINFSACNQKPSNDGPAPTPQVIQITTGEVEKAKALQEDIKAVVTAAAKDQERAAKEERKIAYEKDIAQGNRKGISLGLVLIGVVVFACWLSLSLQTPDTKLEKDKEGKKQEPPEPLAPQKPHYLYSIAYARSAQAASGQSVDVPEGSLLVSESGEYYILLQTKSDQARVTVANGITALTFKKDNIVPIAFETAMEFVRDKREPQENPGVPVASSYGDTAYIGQKEEGLPENQAFGIYAVTELKPVIISGLKSGESEIRMEVRALSAKEITERGLGAIR